VTNRRPLVYSSILGITATALAVWGIIAPGNPLLVTPSSLFWVLLAVLTTAIPAKRLMVTQQVNLDSLVLFTALLLYGTGVGVVIAWVAGIASVVSSRSGRLKYDGERAMLTCGKYVAGTAGAGILLWGAAWNRGALNQGLGRHVLPGLLAAYGVYLAIKLISESVSIWLRDGARPRDLRCMQVDWPSISAWIIPPAAYLLALAYLSSGALTITMLVSVLLVHGLTVGENRRSRSSWIRLTDGLRQACDGHVMRHGGETQAVVDIATAVGHRMKLPSANLNLLGHAAALHNVGYIALDSRLVLRPADLSPEDIAAVKHHPDCSGRILSEVGGMAVVAEIVRSHHESPDGNGYPRGIGGDAIPIEAAIIKLAEAFVAMTSPRVYRGKPLGRDKALEEIAEATGQVFDHIAAYYLFDTMGRGDLAALVSRRFGPPERKAIRERLSRRTASIERTHPRPKGKRIMAGLALLAGALGTVVAFQRFGLSNPVDAPSAWFSLDLPGAVFLVSLLGLASLKPHRLAWGAYCTWATAPVLAMVLAGGPAFVPISGLAFVGWRLLLETGSPDSTKGGDAACDRGDRVGGSQPAPSSNRGEAEGDHVPAEAQRLHAQRLHHRVMARIDRANRVRGDIGLRSYTLVLMAAGTCAWAASVLGYHMCKGSVVWVLLSPLVIGVLCTGVFYMVETFLQAAVLSRGSLSPIRIWYRNYAGAFPEPLTYALVGYGVYAVSGLLGLWTAVLLFTLPVLWRQAVLANRISTLRTTYDLVRSIAKAVDLKNAAVGGHASGVAATAVAIARRMGKGEAFVEQLEDAAILHDIGKASWPNKALAQRVPWDSKEDRYRYVHPDMSAEIAVWAGYSEATTAMIRAHHEHYDGSGYMRGLKEEQIPLGARILCAADSLANMIHGADPRFSRTLAESVREVRFGSGKQFDPEVVQALLDVLEDTVFGETVKPGRDKRPGVDDEVCALPDSEPIPSPIDAG
jgi:HD-GYP domain-containing protein (c-di-GMP phosphodiesterase class II)